MIDILLQLIVWCICTVIMLGIIGLFIMLIQIILSAFKGKQSKGNSTTMPWWVWWSSFRNH